VIRMDRIFRGLRRRFRMKKSLPAAILLSFCLCRPAIAGSEVPQKQTGLNRLLPRPGEVEGWFPDGEPQTAAGDDLFLLIDGGAAIYHEYGFREAVYQTYSTKDGKSINLEVYEMTGPDAAYGMYTFKTGEGGDPVAVGHEGRLESYFLNFWKGNFLVTLVGLDTDTGTLDGIQKIAGAVDAKLQSPGKPPRLASILPKDNLQVNGITYLKGNLGLVNQYRFDDKDIFGLKEGVVGRYDGYSVFLFQYRDPNQARKWCKTAKKHLRRSGRFSGLVEGASRFEMRDGESTRLAVRQYGRWILAVLGGGEETGNRVLNDLETILREQK
jgi:hypothetical protein